MSGPGAAAVGIGSWAKCCLSFARGLEFVAREPLHFARLPGGFLPQRETKLRHSGQTREVPIGVKLVARLMVMILHVLFRLGFTPGRVTAGE
jgi:hypothetical protein